MHLRPYLDCLHPCTPKRVAQGQCGQLAWTSTRGPPLPPAIHLSHGGPALCPGEGNTAGAPGPLAATSLWQRTFIYADDVVAFVRPEVDDLRAFAAIIDDFGIALGLRTNLSKCSAHLIRCPVEIAALVDQELGCSVLPFPP
jgi:hypothetical protein